MTSAETRLREALHQAGFVAVGNVDFDELSRRHRRQVRGRWAAFCTVMVVIVASVVTAVSGGGSDSGRARLVPAATPTAGDTTGSRKLDKSYSAQGGTFRYPSTWRVTTYSVVSSFDFLVAYLSTAPVHDPCISSEGNLSCTGTRVGRLEPGGVLVSWDIYGSPGIGIDNFIGGDPTTIDGRPARIQVKTPAAATDCALIGGSQEVDVAVATTSLHGAGGLWRMNACLADPGSSDAVSTVIAVARSLRLAAPPPS